MTIAPLGRSISIGQADTSTAEGMNTVPKKTERPSLESRMTSLERGMQAILNALGLTDRKDAAQSSPPPRTLTIKEQRARLRVTDRRPDDVPRNVADLMRVLPEPRRQRRPRHPVPRKMYSLKDVTSGKMIQELQHLKPAATAIAVYLAGHPKATVPDLVVQLDLKRKTVENALSLLKIKGLIDVEDRH